MLDINTWPDSWQDVPAGTEISDTLYQHMLNALPPISLRGGHGFCAGFQMGEPIDHKADSAERWRARFLTFVTDLDGKKYYAGLNFGGECETWRK